MLTQLGLVLDPTTKASYIKHYFAPQYQAITIHNIHNLVSTYALDLSYH